MARELVPNQVRGGDKILQASPYTGTDASLISFASSQHKKRITRAISSGFGHLEKSAPGIALRLTAVSIMPGRTEFARTPVPLRSAASESIIATAAALDAAYAGAPAA